ncbi:The BTB (BR-C, ttk and bab)/POZ (Pox virus and Zinc finger) domain [Ceratobasidium sp. AG-Ba]|nr:The BTB (BR-C, ttk and bab)/POZ (Pox virus and Zinc finger) domain [Ceratobasidium sp. AG-Ba]
MSSAGTKSPCLSRSFVDNLNPERCLKVLEIARKYDIGSVERCCQRYLVQKLPVAAADPFENWASFQLYYKKEGLASLAFRICPEYLAPWAFYALAVQIFAKLDKKPLEEVTDPLPSLDTMDKDTVYQMLVLRHVNQKVLAEWNALIDKFYSTKCPKSSSSRDKCARVHTTFDRQSPLYISPSEGIYDPLQLIIPRVKKHAVWKGSTHGSARNYWCYQCSSFLQSITQEKVQEIHLCLLSAVRELGLPRGTPFHSPSSTRANSPSW